MPPPRHTCLPSPTLFGAFLLSLIFSCTVASAATPSSNYPSRPIKLIVPFSAGGSSDTIARIIAKTIRDENLLPQPLVIINVNGASGTIGSRRVKNARPDGYTIMMLHEAIITAKHAGLSPYGPEAFEPIASTGEMVMVLAAGEGAPFDDLKEAAEHAASHPDELIYGTAIGAPTHMMGLIIEREHGSAKFRFTQAGSGAQRIGSLAGGHIDLSPFSIGEYISYQAAGIKALAVFSPQRHPLVPDIPTATELGVPVNSINRNFWWAPKGTPQDRIDLIASVLKKAMQTAYVRDKLALSAITPTSTSGEELREIIAERNEKLSSVTLVKTDAVPNFALWTLGLAVALLAAVFLRRALSPALPSTEATNTPAPPSNFKKSYIVFGLTLIYTAIIGMGTLSFPIATTAYTLILCVIVGGFSIRLLAAAIPFALLMGFGLFHLFTQVLTIDLPG